MSLDQSPLPFNCSLCVQRKQAAQIKSRIAVLTAEVAKLRAAIAKQQQPLAVRPNANDNVSKWSDIVALRARDRHICKIAQLPAVRTEQ